MIRPYVTVLLKRWMRRAGGRLLIGTAMVAVIATFVPGIGGFAVAYAAELLAISNLMCVAFAEGRLGNRLRLLKAAHLDGPKLMACHLLFGVVCTVCVVALTTLAVSPPFLLGSADLRLFAAVSISAPLEAAVLFAPILALAAFLPRTVALVGTNLLVFVFFCSTGAT